MKRPRVSVRAQLVAYGLVTIAGCWAVVGCAVVVSCRVRHRAEQAAP